MIRALFYRGRHFVTTTDDQPVLVTEVAAKLRREARERALDAQFPPEMFGLPREYVWSCFGFTPEQMGAMSV